MLTKLIKSLFGKKPQFKYTLEKEFTLPQKLSDTIPDHYYKETYETPLETLIDGELLRMGQDDETVYNLATGEVQYKLPKIEGNGKTKKDFFMDTNGKAFIVMEDRKTFHNASTGEFAFKLPKKAGFAVQIEGNTYITSKDSKTFYNSHGEKEFELPQPVLNYHFRGNFNAYAFNLHFLKSDNSKYLVLGKDRQTVYNLATKDVEFVLPQKTRMRGDDNNLWHINDRGFFRGADKKTFYSLKGEKLCELPEETIEFMVKGSDKNFYAVSKGDKRVYSPKTGKKLELSKLEISDGQQIEDIITLSNGELLALSTDKRTFLNSGGENIKLPREVESIDVVGEGLEANVLARTSQKIIKGFSFIKYYNLDNHGKFEFKIFSNEELAIWDVKLGEKEYLFDQNRGTLYNARNGEKKFKVDDTGLDREFFKINDQEILLINSYDWTKAYDLESGKLMYTIPIGLETNSLPPQDTRIIDGKTCCTCRDGKKIYDLKNGNVISKFPKGGIYLRDSLKVCDGETLIEGFSGNKNGVRSMYVAETGAKVFDLPFYTEENYILPEKEKLVFEINLDDKKLNPQFCVYSFEKVK